MNKSSREIILINISGQYDVAVLDIGQSIIHDNLTLGMRDREIADIELS